MKNRRGVATASAVAVLLLLGACTSSGSGGGGAGGEGGVLRIGTSSGISSLNPFVGFNQDDYATWMYIYPTLVQYDTTTSTYDYAPNFAESWDLSNDGLQLTFHTTPDATWSDGQPLDSEDVVWTIEMIKKYAHGPTGAWANSVKTIDSIKATDPNTVVVTYAKPTATALSDVGMTPILPEQVWGQYATGDGKGLRTYANEPEGDQPLVGGGPFVLTEYRKNDIALFARNPNWYGTAPHIEGYGLQFYRDEDAMVTALKTGELDAINEIPPTSVDTLKTAGMDVYVGQALALRDFIFNLNPDKPDHPELLDPKVREAFEYAIDRNAIVQTAWLGYAAPGSTLIPDGNATGGVEWHDSAVQPLPFDIDKANQILDDLGYKRGSDGIRVANGVPMSYEVIFPLDEAGAGDRAFRIIQQGLEQVGIQIAQKRLDTNAAWNAMYQNGQYVFDLAMWDWFPAADPDFILSVVTCDEWGNWSDGGYCNHHYDDLYAQQKTAIDPQDRQQIVFDMQKIAFEDRPYIILTYDKRLDAWAPSWDGLMESTQGIYNNFSTQSLLSVHQA